MSADTMRAAVDEIEQAGAMVLAACDRLQLDTDKYADNEGVAAVRAIAKLAFVARMNLSSYERNHTLRKEVSTDA